MPRRSTPISMSQNRPVKRLVRMTIANHPVTAPELPGAVGAFVDAVNAGNLDALLDVFADDALVNDQLQAFWGKPRIREWAADDVVGERLTMRVVRAVDHYGGCVLTAHVDGNFDKRGLPDPLALTFHFSLYESKAVQLIILRTDP